MAEKSWSVSDKFWEKVEPLIPKVKRDKTKAYQRGKEEAENQWIPERFLKP